MIKRSLKVRLADMLAAIDGALEIANGRNFDDYRQSFIMQRATERCVEIVSEASRHLPDDVKDRHPDAYWNEIKAIGNVLRHEYQRVDDLVLWRIATVYFPKLRTVVVELMTTEH